MGIQVRTVWKIFACFVIFLLAASFLAVPISTRGDDDGGVWGTVDVYPGPGTPLQNAINAANKDDVLMVHAGTYTEKLDVHMGITLRAVAGDVVKVTGNSAIPGPFSHLRTSLCTITSVDPVVIDGLEFEYDGEDTWDDAAIKVQEGSNHEIMNVRIEGSEQGIWIHGGDGEWNTLIEGVKVHDNVINNVTGHGIYLQQTWGDIYDNEISNGKEDGIMVAFEWNAPFGKGSIRDNQIFNCSVGVNIVGSNVPNYMHNEIMNCSKGEIFNYTQELTSLQQVSFENNFTNCGIGTMIENGAVPTITGNLYESCGISLQINDSYPSIMDMISRNSTELIVMGTGGSMYMEGLTSTGGQGGLWLSGMNNSRIIEASVEGTGAAGLVLDRCIDAKVYQSSFSGFTDAVLPMWEDILHLRHEIPRNNTADGGPILYRFGDSGADRSIDGPGQVIIANSTMSSYSLTNTYPRMVRVIGSDDIDLKGSALPKGLFLLNSDGISGDGVVMGPSPRLGAALHIDGSTASFYNTVMNGSAPSGTAVKLSHRSVLDMYSGEFIGTNTFEDGIAKIRTYHLIGLEVLYQEGDPVEGAEYRIMSDEASVFSSPLFEGTDAVTGQDGRSGPFWCMYKTITRSEETDHVATFTVNVTADLSWQASRTVDTSTDHVETFQPPDIRRPAIPKNFKGEAVEGGDANRLTWDDNTDDTVFYRVYYLDDVDWTIAAEVQTPSYDHRSAPSGIEAYYKLTAVDEAGLESPPTAEVEVFTVDNLGPEPPRELRISDITDESFKLTWKKSLSPDVAVYEVHLVDADMTRSPGSVRSSIQLVESTAETTITIQGMSDPDNIFAVRALDEAGNPSLWSNPVGLEASDLTWPTISDIEWITGAKSAKISWKTDEPTTCTLWFGSSIDDLSSYGPTALGNDHSYQLKDLTINTTYFFYIHAAEPSGNDVVDDNEGQFYSFTTLASEGYLSIGITDQDSDPVTGVTVLALQGETEVRVIEVSIGHYEAFLIPGNWTIHVVSSDHSPYDPFDVEILPFQWTNTSIQLSSILWDKANLTFTVVDETGNIEPGAVIEFQGKEYITGPGGKVTIVDVATGRTYMVRVSADGFKTLEKEITVPAKGRDQEETFTIIHDEGGPSGTGLLWLLLLIIAIVIFLIVLAIVIVVLKRKPEEEEEPKDLDEEHEDEVEDEEEEEEIKEGSIGEEPDVEDIGVTEAVKKPVKKKGKKEKAEKKEEGKKKEEEKEEEKKEEE
ncbi:MAG: NosD domain-containing protein [Thermoplasmatota archaeon]